MSFLSVVRAGVLIQGLSGRTGRMHARRMVEAGTPVVAGVVPGRGGEAVDGVPMYDTVQAAIEATGARTTVAFLPRGAAVDGLVEAAEAGVELAVCLTEGMELHDVLRSLAVARDHGMRIIGPNSPGIMVPTEFSLGFLPEFPSYRGTCCVLARSGTLSYEVVWEIYRAGLGVSSWIVVGGDRLKGTTFAELVPELAGDGTEAFVLVGEVGGMDEQEAATQLASCGVPAVALIAGRHAPPEKQMGHAGAIVSGGRGTYAEKASALRDVGVKVVQRPAEIATALQDALS